MMSFCQQLKTKGYPKDQPILSADTSRRPFQPFKDAKCLIVSFKNFSSFGFELVFDTAIGTDLSLFGRRHRVMGPKLKKTFFRFFRLKK